MYSAQPMNKCNEFINSSKCTETFQNVATIYNKEKSQWENTRNRAIIKTHVHTVVMHTSLLKKISTSMELAIDIIAVRQIIQVGRNAMDVIKMHWNMYTN